MAQRRCSGLSLLALGALFLGCSESDAMDGGVVRDAARGDAGASGTDAGPSPSGDAGPGTVPTDAGPPPPGTVPIVLGVGAGFSTLRSCDDGDSFIEGRVFAGADCVADGDCSHDPGRALGLAYSNGWFVASFGNEGPVSSLRRTQDGVTWETVHDRSTGGIAAGNGRLVANANPALYSDDDGATWQAGTPFTTRAGANNARAAQFIPYDGGRFLLFYDTGGTMDVMVSADGVTFQRATDFPQDCGPADFAYGNGVAIIVTRVGGVCRSTDGGQTWSSSVPLMANGASTPTDNLRAVIFDEGMFTAYHWDEAYRSADGLSWEPVTVTPGGAHIGTHVATLGGRHVSARDGNNPMISVSADGLAWTDVSPGVFVHQFVAGHALPSACP